MRLPRLALLLALALLLGGCSVSIHSASPSPAQQSSASPAETATPAALARMQDAAPGGSASTTPTSMVTPSPTATSPVPTATAAPTSPPVVRVPTPTPRRPVPTPTPRPPASSPTPTPTGPPACANVPVRGFGLLWSSNSDVARGVGCPASSEIGLAARVQAYENGYMLWLDTTGAGIDQSDWVLTMINGTESRYRVPSSVSDWDETVIAPTGAFKWVWDNVYTDQKALGNASAPEHVSDAALQFFESGTMVWLKSPPGGGKPEIYVMHSDLMQTASGTYQAFPDQSFQ